ncbi:MAG TPA: hypothetical protein VK419_14735, partial [Bryobacteraceae bacterium]|nr:hypothetical protein [Bryobacteraceae bacterium]
MTVCIAAICEAGAQIVVAADRMFTASFPLNLEFEPPLSKIEQLSSKSLAMAAGSSLAAAEIIEATKERIAEVGGHVFQIAIAARDAYTHLRNAKIDEQILNANLGPDFAAFRTRGGTLPAYLQVQPAIYQQLVIQMSQFNLGVDVLIAGYEDNGCHIYHLTHPGSLTAFDKLGYNAIGIGAIHAMVTLHLGEQSPKAPLAATLHAVYDAKIAAEVAPGVGQETEMAVISKDGVWRCSS